MDWIEKTRGRHRPPRLADYADARRRLDWQHVLAESGAAAGAHFNLCEAALDRHLLEGRGDAPALRVRGGDGNIRLWSYRQLGAQAARFAGALTAAGIGTGDCVMAALGQGPALQLAALGSVRAGALFGALFTAFGPDPLARRLRAGRARLLVTTAALYRHKLAPIRDQLPELAHVWLVDGEGDAGDDCQALESVLAAADPAPPAATRADSPALIHFTSGTTGEPKALIHAHRVAVVQELTGRWVLDLGPGDIYWCSADPGWVTGIAYGVFAPLLNGASSLLDGGDFDAARWLDNLDTQGVSVWYTSPTALRMLRRHAAQPGRPPALRHVASVGEPLDADTVEWGLRAFGVAVHDTYWQTETGGIVVANLPALPIRPGAMGLPVPGCTVRVVRPGEAERPMASGEVGELAIRGDWPGLFIDCPNRPSYRWGLERTGWYLTGDRVWQDGEGYLWFAGRDDDMIKTAGHQVGPFEVEGVLMRHPSVAEAGVVGAPDPVAGQVVWAFVVPRPGSGAQAALRREILAHARRHLGPAASPRVIVFRRRLPHTRSGKILRRRLRRLAARLSAGKQSGRKQ